MPTQLHLPVQPAGAQEINAVVTMVRTRGQVAYFASGVPLFVHHDADRPGRRLAEICYQAWKEETDFLAVLRRGGVRG